MDTSTRTYITARRGPATRLGGRSHNSIPAIRIFLRFIQCGAIGLVFALDGTSGTGTARAAGLPVPGDSTVTTEEIYQILEPESFDDRWRLLWSPLAHGNGIEMFSRSYDGNTVASHTIDQGNRSRLRKDIWEAGFGTRRLIHPGYDSTRWSGYLSVGNISQHFLVGDFRPSLPGGLLLSDYSHFEWQQEYSNIIRGSIDPGNDLRGGIGFAQYKLWQFTAGAGDERSTATGKRLGWLSTGYETDELQAELALLHSSGRGTFSGFHNEGLSARLRKVSDELAVESAIAANQNGRAVRAETQMRWYGVSRIELYGASGTPPVDRGELRFRNLRNGIFLEHLIEKASIYRFALNAVETETNTKRLYAVFAAGTPYATSRMDTRFVYKQNDASTAYTAALEYRTSEYSQASGIGVTGGYQNGTQKNSEGTISGFAVRRIVSNVFLTGWSAAVAANQSILFQSLSPLVQNIQVGNVPALSRTGGYLGGGVEWRSYPWDVRIEGWSRIFRTNTDPASIDESLPEIREFRLTLTINPD